MINRTFLFYFITIKVRQKRQVDRTSRLRAFLFDARQRSEHRNLQSTSGKRRFDATSRQRRKRRSKSRR